MKTCPSCGSPLVKSDHYGEVLIGQRQLHDRRVTPIPQPTPSSSPAGALSLIGRASFFMQSILTRALLRLPLATLLRVARGSQFPCSVYFELKWLGGFQYSTRKPVSLVTMISSPSHCLPSASLGAH